MLDSKARWVTFFRKGVPWDKNYELCFNSHSTIPQLQPKDIRVLVETMAAQNKAHIHQPPLQL